MLVAEIAAEMEERDRYESGSKQPFNVQAGRTASGAERTGTTGVSPRRLCVVFAWCSV